MSRKIRYIGIVTFSALLCIFLHLITPPAVINETPTNTLSALALLLGFPLTALLWAGIAYSCVAFVFYLIEDRISGKKGARGLRYGISIGILWLLGYVMCVPKFGNPLINEFVGGLCDATPVVVMGWLLGLFTTKKDVTVTLSTFSKSQIFICITIFVLVFSGARTGSYFMDIIDTGFRVNAVYTLVWTIAMGFCLGIIYVLLGKTVTSSSALIGAVKFGFILFGLTWGIFIMFFPLMLKGELINTMLMFLIDTLSVTAAYYFSEVMVNQSLEASRRDLRI